MSAFEVVRRTHVAADPARVHDLINDFHKWRAWSPWEDVDPALQRDYSGSDSGVGAHYAWSGNRKAGRGTMEITDSNPEQIAIDLRFEKPFRSENRIDFELLPSDGGTDVAWRMTGEQTGLAGLLGKVFRMERLVGGDFEKGLAQLKSAAEN
jgi:Polyketide cyclase / dehydrase and lipid transport